MSRNKRGGQYIDPQVQGALWKRLMWHWILYVAIAVVLVLGIEWMNDPFRPLGEIAAAAWWAYSPMLLVLACLIPVFIYDSIRLSHRFAGPVFRLRQVIHAIAQGASPERVTFRDNDFWKDIAEDMNRVIDRLGDSPAKSEEPQA